MCDVDELLPKMVTSSWLPVRPDVVDDYFLKRFQGGNPLCKCQLFSSLKAYWHRDQRSVSLMGASDVIRADNSMAS